MTCRSLTVCHTVGILIWTAFFIYTTQQMGLPAYSVVTGLGVGGLAVALAGQKMLRDLFGAVVIMTARPYRIGDWVIIGDQEGTVESIGFRSTRIRTFYDSLLSIPNGVVVSKTIDNMGMRTYRRVYTRLSIRDDTAAERIEAFLEGVKRIIQANPTTRKDYFHVVLNDFGSAGLDIALYFFVKVPTWSEEVSGAPAGISGGRAMGRDARRGSCPDPADRDSSGPAHRRDQCRDQR
jgi:MscS family membrane protein